MRPWAEDFLLQASASATGTLVAALAVAYAAKAAGFLQQLDRRKLARLSGMAGFAVVGSTLAPNIADGVSRIF